MQLQRIVSRSYLRITGFPKNRETVKQDFEYRLVPQYTHDDIAKPDFAPWSCSMMNPAGFFPNAGYSFPPV